MANLFKSLFKSTKKTEKKSEPNKDFEILKYDGIRALQMGKVDFAITCFEHALDLEEDFETRTYLGNSYIRMECFHEAIDVFSQLFEKEPNHLPTLQTLTQLFHITSNYTEVKKYSLLGVEKAENPSFFNYMLAIAYKEENDLIQAMVEVSNAITQDPHFIEARLLRVQLLVLLMQYKECSTDLDEIFSIQPEHEGALELQAEVFQKINKENEAITTYQQLIALNPFAERAYVQLGNLYINRNEIELAHKCVEDGLELLPESVDLLTVRAKIAVLSGKKEEASKYLQQAVELKPEELQQLSGTFTSK